MTGAVAVQIISAIIMFVSVLLGVRAAKESIAANREMKSIDVLMHCNMRYEAIYDMREGIVDLKYKEDSSDPDSRKVSAYYIKYWMLQADEHEYFSSKFLKAETIVIWAYSKISRFKSGENIGGLTLEDSWKKIGLKYNKESIDFIRFINSLIELSREPKQDPSRVLDIVHATVRKES